MQKSDRLTIFHKSLRIGQRSNEGTLPGIITNTFVPSIIATNEVDDDAIKSGQLNAEYMRLWCPWCHSCLLSKIIEVLSEEGPFRQG